MPSRAVLERDEPGRRDDARLAHAAAEQLPGAVRAADERARPDDDRADRAAEALSTGRTRPSRPAPRGPPGSTPSATRGVEEPRPVDVERDAVVVGDRGDGGRVGRRAAAGSSSGCGRSRWRRGRSAAGAASSGRGRRRAISSRSSVPSGRSRSCRDRRPDDDGVVGRLVVDDVGLGAGDDLPAARRRGPSARRGCPSSRSSRTGPLPCRAARPRAPRAR